MISRPVNVKNPLDYFLTQSLKYKRSCQLMDLVREHAITPSKQRKSSDSLCCCDLLTVALVGNKKLAVVSSTGCGAVMGRLPRKIDQQFTIIRH